MLLRSWLDGMLLLTGGAGFIGANFDLDWRAAHGETVVNLEPSLT